MIKRNNFVTPYREPPNRIVEVEVMRELPKGYTSVTVGVMPSAQAVSYLLS